MKRALTWFSTLLLLFAMVTYLGCKKPADDTDDNGDSTDQNQDDDADNGDDDDAQGNDDDALGGDGEGLDAPIDLDLPDVPLPPIDTLPGVTGDETLPEILIDETLPEIMTDEALPEIPVDEAPANTEGPAL